MARRRLRTGYTTGTCAAAAAKAATLLIMGKEVREVEVTLPDESRHRLPIHRLEIEGDSATASVIKDAGDDPDITNRAEIVATVRILSENGNRMVLKGGPGVGVVTKPGLPVPVGEPAINPVPRKMIQQAVKEALSGKPLSLEITISVPHGEELAKKTLNPRLGILGGISILGTTGIVKPLSSEAWLATIEASLRVARAVGLSEAVLSFGRTSEIAHMKRYGFPEEAYVLMGDFLEFTLKAAQREKFQRVHLVGQWAKLLKCALAYRNPPRISETYGFTTHVRHGAVRPEEALPLLLEAGFPRELAHKQPFNTAREIFEVLLELPEKIRVSVFQQVLTLARLFAERLAPGLTVMVYLVDYRREVIFEL
ncbi:MAG TPA: cobalamin biosynthesis protein CbiD [Thermodesulfobacteriaceae bacterium]|nr:cobalamin biosynthesis protein CbiD [Thermodesulfobacteriaceae bacterium]